MIYSAVIPVCNEQDSLRDLHSELCVVADGSKLDFEWIFVDDGSQDASWRIIQELAAVDRRVRGIRFRRNFGKAAALDAGIRDAHGELIFTLDADLQDDPSEIPRFLELIAAGNDVVSGWKKIRNDPWEKRAASKLFNRLVSALTGVKLHDHNCGFKCYRREIFDEVRLYGELHRFVPVLAAARGWTIAELIVNHRPRSHGKSKYGFRRYFKGLLDLLTVYFLTGYQQRPQHLLGTVGILSFMLGFAGLTYLGGHWALAQLFPDWKLTPLHQRPAVIYSLGALLFGGQLMSMGFIAELITSYYGRDVATYSVRERLGHPRSPAADPLPPQQSD
jgi:dolichol-phosphate mannosyltransferase